MPTIIRCPHCLHPLLVPTAARGKGRLCRQCGHGYRVLRDQDVVQRLAASTQSELIRRVTDETRTA